MNVMFAALLTASVALSGCQTAAGPWGASAPGGLVAAPPVLQIDAGEATAAGVDAGAVAIQRTVDKPPTVAGTTGRPGTEQLAAGPNVAAPRAPSAPVVRGQSPPGSTVPYGQPPSYGVAPSYTVPAAAPAPSYSAPPSGGWVGSGGGAAVGTAAPPIVSNYQPAVGAAPGVAGAPGALPPPPGWDAGIPVPPSMQQPPPNYADLDAMVQETQTGRFQFGVGVNSDAGVTGQIVIDERNFDATRLPNSWDEVINGTAWRGAGQGFRIEAMPGNRVNRYLVSFTEPYLFGFSPISLNLSAFYFNRNYFDWNEQRLGGRAALGYRLSPDLSVSAALRAEEIDITDPRVNTVPQLNAVVGSNDLFTARFTLTHDTRDIPFFPTEGHYLELAYEQAFGEFSYPRGELDYRKYFLIRERPDGSGRHTLALGAKIGVSGTDTPIFENYFSGGFSTLRGFAFRGASPMENTVTVGGPFRMLMSAEYFFPLTADDMIKGVVFCDAGTTESNIHINWDDFRVAPGFGLRLNIPAMGPAPLALDFAFPVAKADTDNTQVFSFFFGFGR